MGLPWSLIWKIVIAILNDIIKNNGNCSILSADVENFKLRFKTTLITELMGSEYKSVCISCPCRITDTCPVSGTSLNPNEKEFSGKINVKAHYAWIKKKAEIQLDKIVLGV